MNNAIINSKLGHLLIFLTLAASGNVEFRQFELVNLVLAIFVFIVSFNYYTKSFFKFFFSIIGMLTVLFTIQYFVLGFVSLLGILNMYAKIFIAGTAFYVNKQHFFKRFLNVMFFLAIISLLFYSADIITKGIHRYIPAPFSTNDRFYYFFYHSRIYRYMEMYRNPGMFWEPGVFSNYLVICLAFILPKYENLLKKEKKKLLVVFIALITTLSTTGYIVASVVVISKFLLANKLRFKHVFLLLLFLSIGIFVYNNTYFLKDKLESQTERALASEGQFDKTRLGSLLFDLHYIKKHPIVGNGLHAKTRYADHPHLQMEESLGHGNGFSQFIVSYGLLFGLMFFYLVYKRINSIYSHRWFSLVFVLIVILNLQGEPLMNYPFYWGLIFLYNKQQIIYKS
jgi:hypothetical protein